MPHQRSPHPPEDDAASAAVGTFSRSSRSKLTARDLPRFASKSLFDRIGRVVCRAGCLPRKELFEAWEVARRTRRRFRGGRVVDLACGHGLLAHIMLLLDDRSPSALGVDRRLPASAHVLADAIASEWPRLAGRVTLSEQDIRAVAIASADLVVSSHPCGALSDVVIDRAVGASARLALLPCCHDHATCDTGGLDAWMSLPLAIDATRVARLRARNYSVHAQGIPSDITPQNRLLLAMPR